METYTAIKPRMNFSLLAETFRSQYVHGDLGGLTLLSGIYKAIDAVRIQDGDLTLDAKGDENAVWIFQLESNFSTVGGAGGNVLLIGEAKASNVFWQTEQLAHIGVGTSFKGNILSKMIEKKIDGDVNIEVQPVKNTEREKSLMGWPHYGQQL
jgi:hypothetical protein